MRRFEVDIDGTWFRFEPVNIQTWKLFQVYFEDGTIVRRFHMQKDAAGEFYITDKDKLPKDIVEIGDQLNGAIKAEKARLKAS